MSNPAMKRNPPTSAELFEKICRMVAHGCFKQQVQYMVGFFDEMPDNDMQIKAHRISKNGPQMKLEPMKQYDDEPATTRAMYYVPSQ